MGLRGVHNDGRGVEEDGATYLDLVRLKRVRTLHLDERIDNVQESIDNARADLRDLMASLLPDGGWV